MKYSVLSLLGCVFYTAVLSAQPIYVSASPNTVTITGGSTTIDVAVSAVPGFSASVYVSAECPTLPHATIDVSPDKVNVPYTDSVRVTLKLTGRKSGGTHALYIVAKNGPAVSLDSVMVTIPNRSAWTVFSAEDLDAVGSTYWPLSVQSRFALDRKNGVGWMATNGDSLRSYDGSTWRNYAWPDTTSSQPTYDGNFTVAGMAFDSTGHVLVGTSGRSGCALLSFDSTWSVIGSTDSAHGLTASMLSHLFSYRLNTGKIHVTPDSAIWIAASGGIVKFDGTNWTEYTTANSDLYDYSFGTILTDALGNLWLEGYREGITKFDGTYWTYYPSQYFSIFGVHPELYPLAADPDGYVWLRGYNSTIRMHADSDTFRYYLAEDNEDIDPDSYDVESYLGRKASAIDFDKDGDIWIGLRPYTYSNSRHEGGVAHCDGSTWWYYTIDNSGLPDNDVLDLTVDDDKQVWIVTADGSLTILDGTVAPSEVFTGSVSSVGTERRVRNDLALDLLSNPVVDRGQIRLSLDVPGDLSVRIVNSLGNVVATVLEGPQTGGTRVIPFSTGTLDPGCYFLQATMNGQSVVQPMVVVR